MKSITPQELIKALNSGDYTQAQGKLRVDDSSGGSVVGHCCLGVACELAGVPYDPDWAFTDGPTIPLTPPEWAPWLDGHVQTDLVDANDEHSWAWRASDAEAPDPEYGDVEYGQGVIDVLEDVINTMDDLAVMSGRIRD